MFVILAGSTLPSSALAANPARSALHFAVPAIKAPGKYPSNDERCVAEVSPADIGGFDVLTVMRDLSPVASVNGVNGIAWLASNQLVYSISGLLGNPGIYVFDCATGQTKTVVAKGEYFQLLGATSGKDPTLYFFHSRNVSRLHGGAVYRIKLDGSGLAKTGR